MPLTTCFVKFLHLDSLDVVRASSMADLCLQHMIQDFPVLLLLFHQYWKYLVRNTVLYDQTTPKNENVLNARI